MSNYYVNFEKTDLTRGNAQFSDYDDALDFMDECSSCVETAYCALYRMDGTPLAEYDAENDDFDGLEADFADCEADYNAELVYSGEFDDVPDFDDIATSFDV